MSLDSEKIGTYSEIAKGEYEKRKDDISEKVGEAGVDIAELGLDIVTDPYSLSNIGDILLNAASSAGDVACVVGSGAADVAGAAVEVVGAILSGL